MFPNRPETATVLARAPEIADHDATAHLLLGNLPLASGEVHPAFVEWERALPTRSTRRSGRRVYGTFSRRLSKDAARLIKGEAGSCFVSCMSRPYRSRQ